MTAGGAGIRLPPLHETAAPRGAAVFVMGWLCCFPATGLIALRAPIWPLGPRPLTRHAVEIARTARTQRTQQLAGVLHALGDQVLDAILAFQAAFDHQQLRLQEHTALALGQMPPDDHVDGTVLVFQ